MTAPQEDELRRSIRSIKLPNTTVYTTNELVIGNLVDTSLENQILALICQSIKQTELLANFNMCQRLLEKNMVNGHINWAALGGDVANEKIRIIRELNAMKEKK